MAVMRHQGKGCGGGYTRWRPRRGRPHARLVPRVRGGRRERPVIIGFEPDSLGTIDCLTPSRRDDRIRMLAYGVDVLSRLPTRSTSRRVPRTGSGRTHREAAAPDRHRQGARFHAERDPPRLDAQQHPPRARHLRRVGGKPFIINTSYNGRGPIHLRRGGRRINVWCNPPRRGLGIAPTTRTTTRRWTPTCGSTGPATRPARATAGPAGWQLVAGARPDVRALADQLARPTAGHGQRIPPLGRPATPRNLRAAGDPADAGRIVAGQGGMLPTVWGGTQAGNQGKTYKRCRSFAVPTRWRVRWRALCCCFVRRARRVRAGVSGCLSGIIPRTPQPLKLGPVPDIRPFAVRTGPPCLEGMCPQPATRGRRGRRPEGDRSSVAQPAARPALVRGPGRARLPLLPDLRAQAQGPSGVAHVANSA